MPIDPKRPWLVRAADRPASLEEQQEHPLNPNSQIRGFSLSQAVELKRTGVHLLRLSPGKESFAYHNHHVAEEWMFVLSGRGRALVDGEELEVGPGDFLGFPAPSVAHHLTNPFAEELVYLSGGERTPVEVADFPHHNKRLNVTPAGLAFFPLDAASGFDGKPVVKAATKDKID